MTKTLFHTLIILIFSCLLHSFKGNNRNYQTACVNVETDGSVTVKIWDTKKGANYNPEQARKDAIHAILFSGIPAGLGCTSQPPILNILDEQENFKSIEKNFFSRNGKWSMYTRSATTETTLPTNLPIKNWKVYQVTISKNELRKYLEELKIIRQLNQGF